MAENWRYGLFPTSFPHPTSYRGWQTFADAFDASPVSPKPWEVGVGREQDQTPAWEEENHL